MKPKKDHIPRFCKCGTEITHKKSEAHYRMRTYCSRDCAKKYSPWGGSYKTI